MLEPSLEEAILAVLWESDQPLTFKGISQRLKTKGYAAPLKTVQRILNVFEDAGIIRAQSGLGWGRCYQATLLESELDRASSEHLLVKCLTAKHTVIKKQFHITILEKITHLQWFSQRPEE